MGELLKNIKEKVTGYLKDSKSAAGEKSDTPAKPLALHKTLEKMNTDGLVDSEDISKIEVGPAPSSSPKLELAKTPPKSSTDFTVSDRAADESKKAENEENPYKHKDDVLIIE